MIRKLIITVLAAWVIIVAGYMVIEAVKGIGVLLVHSYPR